jgi:hypothetical protein
MGVVSSDHRRTDGVADGIDPCPVAAVIKWRPARPPEVGRLRSRHADIHRQPDSACHAGVPRHRVCAPAGARSARALRRTSRTTRRSTTSSCSGSCSRTAATSPTPRHALPPARPTLSVNSTLSHFQPGFQSVMISVWMALTSVVARLGLVRILRRTFQFLISAFARSPGPRRRAWAVLTAFWLADSGR